MLTHAHGDHANGACVFARAGAQILASAPAADEIRTLGIQTYPVLLESAPWGDLQPVDDCHTVHGDIEVDLGGRVVEVHAVPTRAHTAGDLLVTVPELNVMFAGDLIWNQVTPLAVRGSIRGWLEALDWLATLSTGIAPADRAASAANRRSA